MNAITFADLFDKNMASLLSNLETFNLGDIYGERDKIYQGFKNNWQGWVFYHQCGPCGGKYRIRADGKCYKCKKQLPPYKSLIFAHKMSKFGKDEPKETTSSSLGDILLKRYTEDFVKGKLKEFTGPFTKPKKK